MLLCSWWGPETQVHLPGDQDVTAKGSVEIAKIGIVLHLCIAHTPKCYRFLSALGMCTSSWADLIKNGTQNSIVAMQFGNMLVLLSTKVRRAVVVPECPSLISGKSNMLRTLWRDAFGHVKLQGKVIGMRFLTDKTHVSTCKMCSSS